MQSSVDGLMDWIYINDILTYGDDVPRAWYWPQRHLDEVKPRRSHQWMVSATHAARTSSVLGSTNFYQKFIKFSYKVAAPMGP